MIWPTTCSKAGEHVANGKLTFPHAATGSGRFPMLMHQELLVFESLTNLIFSRTDSLGIVASAGSYLHIKRGAVIPRQG